MHYDISFRRPETGSLETFRFTQEPKLPVIVSGNREDPVVTIPLTWVKPGALVKVDQTWPGGPVGFSGLYVVEACGS